MRTVRTSKRHAFGAIVIALALIGGACSGDDDGPEDDAQAEADPDGEIRLGASLLASSSYVQLDPVTAVTPAVHVHELLYDTLLRAELDGTYSPGLAESAEVVDAQTITIELRDGVTFSDGTEFNAEAVKTSLDRTIAAQNPGAIATEMKQVESITVDGPLALTIKLKTPIAGIFYSYLSRGETMVVSPTALADGVDLAVNPVGAGPFMLDSLQVGESLRLVKNPDHFQADDIQVAAVEFIHIASPEAAQNALRTNAIDVMDNLSSEVIRNLEGSGLETRQEVTDSVLMWGQLCKNKAPLNDVRVRQALNFGLDRDALNDVLYDGNSEPQMGFWTRSSPFHDEELDDYYTHDVEKAKDLLADAGYPDGFPLEVVVNSAGGVSTTATEIIQQQWKEIGVDVTIVSSGNIVEDFFINNRYPAQFFPLQRTGLDKVTRVLVPGTIGNICNWDDPDLNELVAEIRKVAQDSEEAIALWHELDALALERAMNVFGVFGTTANAWNDSLGGVEFRPNFQGVPTVDLFTTFVKA